MSGYGAEKDWKALTKDEQDALLAQDDVLRKRGALMAAVEPAVKTVRAWDGNPSVTAGAFAQSDVPPPAAFPQPARQPSVVAELAVVGRP